jgi:amino acid transporter
MAQITNEHEGTLGLATCVTMIVGGMIGSAIFSLSGMTIYGAGPAAIVSWVIAAAIMLSYGLIVAELSAFFPKSGGVFVFPSKALGKNENTGKLWGWISTWGYFNANIVAIAFGAIYVATYLGVGFPVFAKLQVPLAIAAIVFCFVLNALRISITGKVNTVLVCGLAVTLLTFIIIAFTSGQWDSGLLTPFFSQGASGRTGFLSVVPIAMVAYGSIVSIAFMVSEVKNPTRNVPRSIFIAMSIVVCLYSLVILATVGLVSAQFLADNSGMRFIPLYAAAFTKLAEIPWLVKVISVSAVLALLTTILVVMALTSRAIHAAAESGIIPQFFAVKAKNGSPIAATALVALLSAVVSCFTDFTQTIVNFGALFAAITMSINCVSLLAARKKFTHAPGDFRAPFGSGLPVVTLAVMLACYVSDIMGGGWVIWVYTAVWYAVGLLIFVERERR